MVRIWHIPDGAHVDLPIDHGTDVEFSPDGRWLMTAAAPCRLWEVGTWREVRHIGDTGHGFSPDGRLLVAETSRAALRLVETQTGTTLAPWNAPTIRVPRSVAFSPDGSKLVVSTEDKPAVHVWDLRMIRRHLVGMGLDWKAPAYSEDDAASPSRPPLPALEIDYGELAGHVDVYRTPWSVLYDRSTAEINKNPHDDEAYHHRATHRPGWIASVKPSATSRAIELRPDDAHYRFLRAGTCILPATSLT